MFLVSVLLENGFDTSINYLKYSKVLIVSSLTLALFFGLLYGIDYSSLKKNSFLNKNFTNLLKTYKWFIVAFSTVLPFIAVPELALPRTSIYFMFFLMVFIVIYVNNIFEKRETIRESRFGTKYFFHCYGIVILFLAGIFLFSFYNLKGGITLKNKMIDRERKLRDSNIDTIEIKPINYKTVPICYRFIDVHISDKYPIFLECYEEYYHKKVVVVY